MCIRDRYMGDIVVDEVGPSRVRLTYLLNEGRRARIRKVTFEGNDTIKAGKLRKLMKTKRAWWFLGGKLEEDKLETDLKNILDEYGNHGRLEAEITKTDILFNNCLLYTSPSPRDQRGTRMPSSA
eukprot:TRINITY_DN12218_c0_g1_i1.p1 TRINITY_DN12218_c0_g1~~TRINITY_DN12218_c0_g1_i1.p1  ORF type:complete len:134 (-),score=20.86 TRINITY_DN12218_c0_g1_i1:10-384(-)